MKKQNFIKSSAILIVSVMISKIAGVLFRIPLASLLGGKGMAYFSGAYGLFLPVYAVFVSGFSAASAKVTAEYDVIYGSSGAEKVKRGSLVLFSLAGAAGTLVMLVLAWPFSVYAAGSDRIWLSLVMISPSVFFSCVSAAYRGYYEGHCMMFPTAVSQVIESVAKLVLGISVCLAVQNNASWFKARFTCICTDVPALSAAGASAGVMVSVLAGTLCIVFYDFVRNIKKKNNKNEICRISSKRIIKELAAFAVPVAAGALMSSLASLVDLCTIIRYTGRAVRENPLYFTEKYSFAFLEDVSLDNFAEFAYGSFCGMAVTVFNLVPSFTNMFGKSIFPACAGAWAGGNTDEIKKSAEKVIKITAIAALPAGCGICMLSGDILSFLFPHSAAETMFCTESLRYLGISVIFLCLSFPVFSILQAIGKAGTAARIMFAGTVLKAAGNILLVRIPWLNVSGAAISTGLCYLLIFFMSLYKLKKITGIRFSLFKLLSGPMYASLMCSASAWIVRTGAFLPADEKVKFLVSVLCGAFVYFIVLFFLGEYKFFSETAECRKCCENDLLKIQ